MKNTHLFIGLLSLTLLFSCKVTAQESYLYKDAEWYTVSGSLPVNGFLPMVAKDSIHKRNGFSSFIINDNTYKKVKVDCSKSLINTEYVFKNGVWGKKLSPNWRQFKDTSIKNFVCQ